MKPPTRFRLLLITLAGLAVFPYRPTSAQDYSHARIVRLSFVEGTVAVQRPDVTEWAAASVNTPIQEGFRLATSTNGFAEVEFEDASTARIGQLTLLEFTQLALEPTGGKVNRIVLQQGYATFHVTPARQDLYEIKAGDTTLTVHPEINTMFRVDLDGGLLRVEVFKGFVDVSSSFGARTLGEESVYELRPRTDQPERESNGITKDAWDEWVDQREMEAIPLQNRNAPGGYSNYVPALLYGSNDLWNYGTWCALPGYRYRVWVPRVPQGWAPYTIGRWSWYPGLGYTWISGEPWGWLPYHCGEWVFEPSLGWCWVPGALNSWSPAVVDWYQGAGWIGWGPRSTGVPGGGADGCPPGQRCHTFVKAETVTNGKAVSPSNAFAVAPSQVQQVEKLDVPPSRNAMLPGPAVPQGRGLFVEQMPEPGASAGNPSGSVAGSAPAPRAQPTVVFDPVDRRFVNAPAPPSAVQQPGATRVIRGGAPRSVWSSSDFEAPEPRPEAGRGRFGPIERSAPAGIGATPVTKDPGRSRTPGVFHEAPSFGEAPSHPSSAAPSPARTPSSSGSSSQSGAHSSAAPPPPAHSDPPPSAGAAGAPPTSHGGAFGTDGGGRPVQKE